MNTQTHNPVVYFVIDSATMGVDFLVWGISATRAEHDLFDMIAQGYEVEMRSYELADVPENLITMSGLHERLCDEMSIAGL